MGYPAEKILVATDGSPNSDLAVRKAAAMARAFYAELHLAHVVPVSRGYSLTGEESTGPGLYEEDLRAARQLLEKETVRAREAGWEPTETHLREGEPVAEVLGLAEESGADLIVVGSRGLNPRERPPIGSVSSGIATHAPCPVLIVREGSDAEPARTPRRAAPAE